MIPKIFIPIIAVVVLSIAIFGVIIYKNQMAFNEASRVPVIRPENKGIVVDERQKSVRSAEEALAELRKKGATSTILASTTVDSVRRAEKALEELRKKAAPIPVK